jgi:death-on-curing protein
MPGGGTGENEIRYLDAADVIQLHAEIVDCTEREAADRLRSLQGMEGAVARPAWHALHGHADLAMQAAVLAHGIAEGQIFIDANKRTALVALRTFLRLNGWGVEATQEERADWIMSLSAGTSPEQLAERLRAAMRRVPLRPSG